MGCIDGRLVGDPDGCKECNDGKLVGCIVGWMVGNIDGSALGIADGHSLD